MFCVAEKRLFTSGFSSSRCREECPLNEAAFDDADLFYLSFDSQPRVAGNRSRQDLVFHSAGIGPTSAVESSRCFRSERVYIAYLFAVVADESRDAERD